MKLAGTMVIIMMFSLIQICPAQANSNDQDIPGKTPLMSASKDDNPAAVEDLLKNGSDIHATDRKGKTALMYAAHNSSSVVVINVLLKNGADVNAQDTFGRTALMYTDHPPTFAALLKGGADINIQDNRGITVLMSSQMGSSEAVVNDLLNNGADINIKDIENTTALMHAAQQNKINYVAALIKHGAAAGINSKDSHGKTPLMYSAREKIKPENSAAVIPILLENGADINAQDEFNNTALIHAAQADNIAGAAVLLDNGADVNAHDQYGETSLMFASQGWEENAGMIALLLKHGAELDAQDNEGWTPLMHATFNDREVAVAALQEAGADTTLKNKEGETAAEM